MHISVIIPTRNRSGTLKATLASIYRNLPAFSVEVIVADNGSTDDTALICDQFKGEANPLRYVFDAEPGLLTGRHIGAQHARGEILCFLDDDVEISATWFDGVHTVFADAAVQLATGPCLPKYETTPPDWLQHFWDKLPGGGSACSWLSLIDLGPEKMEIHPNLVWGLNFCIRKAALQQLGGFHPDNIPAAFQAFQGDGETGLTRKAFMKGYRAMYHPLISLYHQVSAERMTEQYFKKRAFYQGVCDSFAELRSRHLPKVESTGSYTMSQRLATPFRRKLSPLKNRLFPRNVHPLKVLFAVEERKGFEFHQRAFNTDARVRDWVLRTDYWNYKLPE